MKLKPEPSAGEYVIDVINRMISQAQLERCNVTADFNGDTLEVKPGDTAGPVHARWEREIERKRKEYEASPEYAARQIEDAKQEAKKQMDFETAMKDAPELELKDGKKEEWGKFVESNQDPYGAGVVRYATNWGRIMQKYINLNGCSVGEAAQATQFIADSEGITGFMYGCAVHMLSDCWIHGEELRRWHNLDTQIGDEGERANETGGVLNPALLSIGDNA